jgi:hypothetical protein
MVIILILLLCTHKHIHIHPICQRGAPLLLHPKHGAGERGGGCKQREREKERGGEEGEREGEGEGEGEGEREEGSMRVRGSVREK